MLNTLKVQGQFLCIDRYLSIAIRNRSIDSKTVQQQRENI